MNRYLLAGAALLAWWYWDQSKVTAAPETSAADATKGLTVNAAPTVINEDTTGAAIRDLITQFQQNPDLRVAFSLKGAGLVLDYGQRPAKEEYLYTRGTNGGLEHYQP